MVNVLIYSDVCLLREGVTRILDESADLRAVNPASSTAEAAAALSTGAVDVVLIDLGMPHALEAAKGISRGFPSVSIVALGVSNDEEDVVDCAEAGITGYVRREGSAAELMETIRCVRTGELPCTRSVAGALIRRLAVLSESIVRNPSSSCLTQRQVEIVRLLDEGLTNKEIGRHLSISPATVRNHVHAILERLGVRTRARAAAAVRASTPLR